MFKLIVSEQNIGPVSGLYLFTFTNICLYDKPRTYIGPVPKKAKKHMSIWTGRRDMTE